MAIIFVSNRNPELRIFTMYVFIRLLTVSSIITEKNHIDLQVIKVAVVWYVRIFSMSTKMKENSSIFE